MVRECGVRGWCVRVVCEGNVRMWCASVDRGVTRDGRRVSVD